MAEVLAEPICGRIDWIEDHGTVVLMGLVADDGEEHVIPWDHRPLGWFLDANPRPLGLLVEFGDDGLVVLE
jgi:hypothetical protein